MIIDKERVMSKKHIIVIGGGIAGFMAAYSASEEPDVTVTLLEKSSAILSDLNHTKVLITAAEERVNAVPLFNARGKFLHTLFKKFFYEDCTMLLDQIGVSYQQVNNKHIYTNDTSTIKDLFLNWIQEDRLSIQTDSIVQTISQHENIFTIQTNNKTYSGDAVIIATGSLLTHPYNKTLLPTHTISELSYKTTHVYYKNIHPVPFTRLPSVSVSLWIDNKKISVKRGEFICQRETLAGHTIRALSNDFIPLLDNNTSPTITVDLIPSMDHQEVDQELLRIIQNNPKETIVELIEKLLNSKAYKLFLPFLPMDTSKTLATLTTSHRKWIKQTVKELPFTLSHYRHSDIFTTAGGVSLKEINPHTLESNRTKGIYLAGTIIDIDSNDEALDRQFAFSSGYVAGKYAAGGEIYTY